MPLVEKLSPYRWEARTKVPDRIARVVFTVDGQLTVLLHGVIKKTRKVPQREIATARTRLPRYQEAES